MKTLIILAAMAPVVFGLEAPEWVSSSVTNVQKSVDLLELAPYLKNTDRSKTKIAVLGHRYGDLVRKDGTVNGKYLPKDTEYSLDSLSDSSRFAIDTADDTDRRLAQVIWAMTGYDEKSAPKFRLLNANGPSNFSASVDSAIAWGADIILSTESFLGFGNLNGTGPVIRIVEKATQAGILWVQSVGSKHLHVVEAPIICQDGFVYFADKQFGIPFLLHADNQKVRVTLTYDRWPLGRDTQGTRDDLNLRLYKGNDPNIEANRLASSTKKQVLETDPETENTTLLPLEEIEITLNKGDVGSPRYHVYVQCEAGTFAPSDKLRLIFETDKAVSFDDKGKEKSPLELEFPAANSIQVPADFMPGVGISVGDLSRYTSRGTLHAKNGRKMEKPEVVLEYGVQEFSDGVSITGPDLAAARIAAAATLMRAYEGRLSPKHLYALARLRQNTEQLATDRANLKAMETAERKKSLLWTAPEPATLTTWLDENP